MKEIDEIIELQTNTETEKLSFSTKYLVQINFTFHLTVKSAGFSGTSRLCVRRDEIQVLCNDLSKMHSALKGTARLDDNDSDAFIEFNIEANGRLNINGQVGGSHEEIFLKFKFGSDQTRIPKFVQDFKLLLSNY